MFNSLVSRVPMAKGCADCRLTDCGSESATSRFRDFGPPGSPMPSADSQSAWTTPQSAPLGNSRDQLV
eukprot:15440411-Alexandrium_andersonii.AAC.1